MPDTFNNIFITTENLAFSLPLIFVCVTYVYFTYIPLRIGIPILVGLFVLSQIYSMFKKMNDKKLTKLDEGTIQNIIGELEDDENLDDKENKKSNHDTMIQKAKHRVQLRLAMEKKAAARKGNTSSSTKNDNDENDDTNLTTFVKNSSSSGGSKSKKKL